MQTLGECLGCREGSSTAILYPCGFQCSPCHAAFPVFLQRQQDRRVLVQFMPISSGQWKVGRRGLCGLHCWPYLAAGWCPYTMSWHVRQQHVAAG